MMVTSDPVTASLPAKYQRFVIHVPSPFTNCHDRYQSPPSKISARLRSGRIRLVLLCRNEIIDNLAHQDWVKVWPGIRFPGVLILIPGRAKSPKSHLSLSSRASVEQMKSGAKSRNMQRTLPVNDPRFHDSVRDHLCWWEKTRGGAVRLPKHTAEGGGGRPSHPSLGASPGR